MSPQLLSVSICHKVLTGIFQNKNLDFQRLYLFLCRNQRKNFKCSRQHMHNFCSLIPLEATLAIQLDKAQTSLYLNFSVWTYPRLHPYSQLRITICTSRLPSPPYDIGRCRWMMLKCTLSKGSASGSTHKHSSMFLCGWKPNRSSWGILFLRDYFHIICLHG